MEVFLIIQFMFLIQSMVSTKMVNKYLFDPPKKIISISPGGYKGFYLLGVSRFIIDHYNTENYVFSGASAGAWVSLASTYQGNTQHFLDTTNLLEESFFQSNQKNLLEIQDSLKEKMLEKFTKQDFDFSRLFIGVVQWNHYQPSTNIYTDFETLEDALNCCISSSHIPYITGNMINRYDNKLTFDGGFSSFPYLNTSKHVLHIHANMWKPTVIHPTNVYTNLNKLYMNMQMFSKGKYNFKELYYQGYEDSKIHKQSLDSIFV